MVACLQDNGIDAELLPNGSVHADSQGTLSIQESRALSELCHQRLEDEGFIVHEEPTDESRERGYNEIVALRECLVEKGYAIPALVSFETFVAHPAETANLFDDAIREGGVAFVEEFNKCRYQYVVRADGIEPTG